MEPPSSPPSVATSPEDALSWYKTQYEQLELELADFRESSRELEKELEKDLDRAEKQERVNQQKAESLGFEVEEWKRKYKESKTEASSAQTALEKEITQLRDSNRTLHLKLRDSEVANDDFERQARNTTSSLEDMESKYNQAIERSVMMESEIKLGEQERETLRIESQRLREELSDLKIEAELMQDKIKKHENRHLSVISTDLSVLGSPTFDKHLEASPGSTASSPLVTTPPEAKSVASTDIASEPTDPPSPPMSDASSVPKQTPIRPVGMPALKRKTRLPSLDNNSTSKLKPKTTTTTTATTRLPGSRLSTAASTSQLNTPSQPRTTKTLRAASHKLPASNSLSHIRNLTAQMQRLEQRVQSVRSKLPGPSNTPPRASPRANKTPSALPASVTIRSRRRGAGSTASSVFSDDSTPTHANTTAASTTTSKTAPKSGHMPRLSTSGISRLSFGPGPLPNRAPDADSSRPSSRASMSSYARPPSRTDTASSYARPSSRTDMVPPPRPMSRSSISGARTPLGRPRSSMSLHGHNSSVSYGGIEEEMEGEFRTPSRRGTLSKLELESGVTGIPMPSAIPTPSSRRQSASRRSSTTTLRESTFTGRASTSGTQKLSDLGETY